MILGPLQWFDCQFACYNRCHEMFPSTKKSDCYLIVRVVAIQDYLVNILLETATKEHCEGARYVILAHIVLTTLIPVCLFLHKCEECVLQKNILPFRCIAVCSLGLLVCEELMQEKIHHQVKDAINVLGVTLKVSERPRRGSFVFIATVSSFQFNELHSQNKQLHMYQGVC